MIKNLFKKYSIPLTFFLIIGIAFVIGLPALYFAWMELHRYGSNVSFWTMVEALSALFTATAVLGAGFVAYQELSEISNSRYLEVANLLFEELNSIENINARRIVFQDLPDDPATGIQTLSTKNQEAVKRVLNSLDHVAFLTQAGWIPKDLIMPWMHPMITKSWIKLKPYVEYERQRRNEPYYYQYAGRIAEECLSWRKDNITEPDEIKWLKDAL